MKLPYRIHLIVIGLYTLLTILFTWPMTASLASHIPGEATWAFDESTFIWNMWWLKHSVLTLQQSPLYSNYTFFPLGIDLTTYTFNLFNAAFGLPLQLALTLPLANNLTLLFSYISSGYGTFLLVLYLLQTNVFDPNSLKRSGAQDDAANFLSFYLAAFLAGTVFAFSASRMMYIALGHYNFVTIQWFPFYTLFLLKVLHKGTPKSILLAGLFAALCLYAELTYSVFLLFLTLIIVIGERVWRHDPLRQMVRLAAVGGLTLLFSGPFILAVVPDFIDPAFAEPGWGEGLKLSADLVGLVTITPLHPWYDVEWVTELRNVIEGTSRFSDANTLFLGYGILALALIGFLRFRRAGRVWLWSVMVFTILSLGPLLTINGQNRFDLDGIEATFPLPFALLHYIPIINANRVPNRFGIPLTLALAVLVGFAAWWLLTKMRSHSARSSLVSVIAAIILLFILMVDQYSVPLSLTDARIPEVYHQIGAEPDDFTIMQLPLGWRNSYGTLGSERTQLQYYQAAHRRPMLGGNTSRNPAFKFDYYRNIPLFQALTETELYRPVDETTLAQAREQATELMTLYNIKYLVIHEPLPRRVPYEDTALATRRLALELIPHQTTPVYQSPGVQAFAVEQLPLPNPHLIDFGQWRSTPYRGAGWAGNETIFAATANWVTAHEAMVFVPIRGEGDRTVSITIAPFTYPDMPSQTVRFDLNGVSLPGSQTLSPGWQVMTSSLPAQHLTEGLNRLTLHFSHIAQPRQVLPAEDGIGTTGVATPVDIEVNSGADFAFITVGFAESAVDASAHRRGINIAVIDPQSGNAIDTRGFDTAANGFEADALQQFIDLIEPGQIVVAASQGEDALAYFDEGAFAALSSIGVTTPDLSAPFSAIGVKGAAPGQALQTTGSAESTAFLRRGAIPDARNLAAAVDQIIIEKP